MTITDLLVSIMGGGDLPIRLTAFDGSSAGPEDAATHLDITSPNALRRIIATRGQELGFARSIVAGEIEIHGDIFGVFDVNDLVAKPTLDMGSVKELARHAGIEHVRDLNQLRSLTPPPEEIKLRGIVHSKARDAEAISSHYDVSNEFYDIILGESMTYSCAIFEDSTDGLFDAQANKHDLVCRKLDLRPGQRLLDIGCGWGSMVIHAARDYDVRAVGVTISVQQAERARKRVAELGLTDQVEIRVQDYRDVRDGPYDAISSIGMSEHVGDQKQLKTYFEKVRSVLAPNGRFVNHAISRSPQSGLPGSGSFIQRYVFPDGELHTAGATVSALQGSGFEARHLESFRLHYARTLRHWVDNLENNWDEAVAEVGRGRALVWRLYMAGSAVNFERGNIQLHQVLAVDIDADNSTIPALNDWTATRNR